MAKERENARAYTPRAPGQRGHGGAQEQHRLTRPRHVAGEMEGQLQDVLSLWENAAKEAKGDAAAENAELRRQVESLQAQLSAQEAAARTQEATMRAEMEQIMKLWDEAQRSSAAEVEHLQDRIVELKDVIANQREQGRRLESRIEEYGACESGSLWACFCCAVRAGG